ncbi:hypothetical protein KIMH_12980 [Bombiscardovia apis]|uniref:Superfamily I DNA and RNA helicase n=1 Tax=Bombiscardovia apis TaxID=2932182 RepID=A0ABN6SIT5_9BIFI|nr:hypothetical protein [Bombiscardovia apis]BDR55187.1 hypothetical protein KIMH_12980 [Bombiscardovia apis]
MSSLDEASAACEEVSGQSPRRTKRHKRVVRRGTEHFEGDGLDDKSFALGPREPVQKKLADDDRRILNELPPHWGQFPAEKG